MATVVAAEAASAGGTLLSPVLEELSWIVVYTVVWGIVFVSAAVIIGFFLPGSSLLFGSGIIASAAGSGVNIWVLTIGTFTAAVLGNQVGYVSGRQLGRPFLDRRVTSRTRSLLERSERFYARYGWWAVVNARYIPWIRTFTPFIAGVSTMNPARFFAANVTGALTWAAGITVAGYWAGSIPVIQNIAYGVAGFFIVGAIISAIRQNLALRRHKADA